VVYTAWRRSKRSSCGDGVGAVPGIPASTRRGHWCWPLISVMAIGIALVGALAPEIEYDALAYHLNLPKLWLSAGQPVDLDWELTSLYPLTWELIFGAALALGGPIAAKLIHFSAFVITALLIYEIARRYLPTFTRGWQWHFL
jgi:hypothetical protein